MKLNRRFLAGLLCFVALITLLTVLAMSAFAQTNGSGGNPPIPGATTANPTLELSKLFLAVIVPLVVAGIKKVAPKIPSASLPFAAAALGALADWGGAQLGIWHGNILVGLLLGAAGVGVREGADQLKQLASPSTDTPK